MHYLLFLLLLPLTLFAGEVVPRRVIVFWDSKVDKSIDESEAYLAIEMPLNYLGLDAEYHDIQSPLPEIANRSDVRGMALFLNHSTQMSDPVAFIDWALAAIDKGKKIAIIGYSGFSTNTKGAYTNTSDLNRLFERLGFVTSNEAADNPYDYAIVHEDKAFLNFEASLPHILPSFSINRVNRSFAKVLLQAAKPNKPESRSDLIIVSPNGGYVSPDYALLYIDRIVKESSLSQMWYLNPFRFLEAVFDTSSGPIPDTTTLAGRRIYYSHIDGDSWNISSTVDKYKAHKTPCAAVLLEEVIKPNPDLPVTAAPIAADLDPEWAGEESGRQATRDLFAQPNVEAGSHTYSHPFQWSFFEHNPTQKEVYFLNLYPYGSWQNSFLTWLRSKYYDKYPPSELTTIKLDPDLSTPRAYANKPFNLKEEITGSIDYINQFAPENNKVRVLQWPGDCLPWGKAVELCYEAGVRNHNGGDTRLDPEFPSVLFVSPLGRKPGGWIQILASNSAEVSYTNEWTERFYGFKYVQQTWNNTNAPRRLKPLSLYYHAYSGQLNESLGALLDNIAYVRTQEVIPIYTSRFVDAAVGFYSLQCVQEGKGKWAVKNRKGLQTLRFDGADLRYVNLPESSGVVGFRKYLDSIYVYLDAAVEEPVVQMEKEPPHGSFPYLVNSSWEIWNLVREKNGVKFLARGFGNLSMVWEGFRPGTYVISPSNEKSQELTVGVEGLTINLSLPFDKVTEIEIRRL